MSEDAQWRERSRSPIPRVVSQRSRSPAPVHHDRERQRSRSFERRAPRRAPAEHPQVDPSEHLSFFNLERGLNEEDLEREVMDVVGYHCRFTIARDAKTRTSKGFGFVKLESVDDAIRVKEALHDKRLNGRNIRIDFSTTKRPHEPTPGKYLGKPSNSDRSRERNRDDRRDFGGNRDRAYQPRDNRYQDDRRGTDRRDYDRRDYDDSRNRRGYERHEEKREFDDRRDYNRREQYDDSRNRRDYDNRDRRGHDDRRDYGRRDYEEPPRRSEPRNDTY